MAYENRIYIVNVNRKTDEQKERYGGNVYAETIAVFNLCCMGYCNGWRELFDRPIDFQLYSAEGNEVKPTDYYGKQIKSADFGDVIRWLEMKGDKEYRRTAPFLSMLKGFNQSEWKELHVVHFGC